MVLPEAMSFGLSVVTSAGSQVPAPLEIIEDRKSGFLVSMKQRDLSHIYSSPPLTPSIDLTVAMERLALLIENKNLREEMGMNAERECSQGKLSMEKRNRRLEEIYRSAIS